MNFIYISPNYPSSSWQFCDRLRRRGVNVLGIGDAPFFHLTEQLRNVLTEYYYVDSLKDYDQVYRAVAYFAFKYGKPDWLESNNEYWLEQDARLRTDFHITTGLDSDGFAAWRERQPRITEFPRGVSCAYDAITDAAGSPLFESMTVWQEPSPRIPDPACFTCPEIPQKLLLQGREALRKLEIRSRFAHLQYIRTGEGDNAEFTLMGTGMAPGGPCAVDMMNYAHSTDLYQIWTDMVTAGRRIWPESGGHHWCVKVVTRDRLRLLHSQEDVLRRYGDRIAIYDRTPDYVRTSDASRTYIAHAYSEEEVREFIGYVQAQEEEA